MRKVAKRFLEYLKNEKNTSSATIDAYGEDLQKFMQFLQERHGKDVLPGDVTRDMIRASALFISTRNRRIGRTTVWDLVRKYCADAKIRKSRLGPHILRHTFSPSRVPPSRNT